MNATMTEEATLIRAYYRSVGPKLTVDALNIDFEVDGEVYTHQLPNKNWSYQTPALMFMGYAELQPTDFDDSEYEFESETVQVVWNNQEDQYMIAQPVLFAGIQKLKEAKWFSQEGTVWNNDGSQAVGGLNVEPGTGNRAGVPIDGEE